MKRRMLSAAAIALALAAAPTLAYAAESDVQNLAAGDALHNEATVLLNQGKLEESSKKYGEAFAKSHNPASLYAQGYVETELKHWKVALKLFRAYLALPANVKITADWRKKAEGQVAACEKKLCRIDVRAEIFQVDGRPESGIVVEDPGAHAITMTEHGVDKTKTITCTAGELVTIAYDEKGPGQVGPITPPPKGDTERGSWVLPAVLAGVGVVGLGVGFGLGAVAKGKSDDLETGIAPGQCADASRCTEQADKIASIPGLNAGAAVGYVVGGVGLVGAVVATLVIRPWEERPVRKTASWLAPSVGPNGFGVVAAGSF